MNTSNISVNTQSSIRIAGTRILYFDPFKISRSEHDADIVFITHAHYDHLDPGSVEKVSDRNTIFVAPASMALEMKKVAGEAELVLMAPGDKKTVSGIPVQAVPAYNRLKPFHSKRNGWVGYVITMDGISYYVAGDTDALSELSEVVCDVALVPIGGTYTMAAKDAAKLINEIHPSVVIPTHYGSIVGKPKDADVFSQYIDQDIRVETRL